MVRKIRRRILLSIVLVIVLCVLSSCMGGKNKYSIYKTIDNDIEGLSKVGNYKNEIKVYPEKIVLDKGGTLSEYNINGVKYELEYLYTMANSKLKNYDVDFYKVLNATEAYKYTDSKESTYLGPTISFVSGTDTLNGISNMIISDGKTVSSQEDLASIAYNFLSKYIELSKFEVSTVQLPGSVADRVGDMGSYGYSLKINGYKLHGYMPYVGVNSKGEIVIVELPNLEYIEEMQRRDFEFDEKECEKLIYNSMDAAYEKDFEYTIESKEIFISNENKRSVYYRTFVNTEGFTEICDFILELD